MKQTSRLVVLLWLVHKISLSKLTYKEYCVIGGGPAGLQMGYFLMRNKRDYVIFEKAAMPGSFFTKFPRHRKLISINKRNTGRTNKEFNLRHDWNSLLSDNETLLFTRYTKEYFPHADTYLNYLRDYHQFLNISVQFNTEISAVRYMKQDNTDKADSCRFSMQDQNKNSYCCRVVLLATGIAVAAVPEMKGSEYVEGYETVSTNPEDFEGQSVMIIGKGNSGLEVASSIYGYASFVHLVGRDRVKFSWETHYVGDIRAVNNEVLDSYMLKSLDGVFEADVSDIDISKRHDGKLIAKSISIEELNTEDHNPVREGYDRIIRCLGFQWDSSIFHNSSKPSNAKYSNKFPAAAYDYQSIQFPGLYFIGPLAHSLDFKKSAGGFIHGFRYTIRAIYKLLEWQYHGIKWPFLKKDWKYLVPTILKRANEASGIYQMFQHLCDVAVLSKKDRSFIYLEDFPVNLISKLKEKTGHEFFSHNSLVILNLEYGRNFSHVGEDHFDDERAHGVTDEAHLSNFLHPVVYFEWKLSPATDKKGKSGDKAKVPPLPAGVHHVLEDFTTNFDGPTVHALPLRRFLEFFLEDDLRSFFSKQCINFAITSLVNSDQNLPSSCTAYSYADESVSTWM